MARVLTEEEEDQVLKWLKANRFLYDKSSYDFKNREKKDRTWLEMDQKLNLNPGDLFRLYSGLRTQYVKEVKRREDTTRSGAGATEDVVTPRINWLMERFEFVKPFVCQTRKTKGSNILNRVVQGEFSDASVSQLAHGSKENTTTTFLGELQPQSASSKISEYLDKVSQQLAVPKNDIEKTCDFLSTLMAKMTPQCLDDFTNDAISKAFEYVKLSNQESRQTAHVQPVFSQTLDPVQRNQQATVQFTQLQVPQQVNKPIIPTFNSDLRPATHQQMFADYTMVRNMAASNPPADVLQQHGRYQWTEIQPSNLQPLLPGQIQPTSYPTQVVSNPQIPIACTSTSTSIDTPSVFSEAYDTINTDFD